MAGSGTCNETGAANPRFFYPYLDPLRLSVVYNTGEHAYSDFDKGPALNISQLYSFIVVAQNENLSKAASMLYISQSALSKSIAKLEEELGVSLFDRKGKKIVLNAQGKRFLESSIDILREIEFTTQDLRALASGQGYKLRIGCAGPSAPLCDCLLAFCGQHPNLSFEIDTDIEQLDYVEMNNYDLLIYPTARPFEKLRGYPLITERYCVAMPRTHRLAGRDGVTADDLMDEGFVFIRRGIKSVEHVYRLCGSCAIRISKQYFVDSHEMQRYFIGKGMGLGFVSDFNRAFYENDPNIVLVPMDEPTFEHRLMICFRESDGPLVVEKEFREFVIDYFNVDTTTIVGGRQRAEK